MWLPAYRSSCRLGIFLQVTVQYACQAWTGKSQGCPQETQLDKNWRHLFCNITSSCILGSERQLIDIYIFPIVFFSSRLRYEFLFPFHLFCVHNHGQCLPCALPSSSLAKNPWAPTRPSKPSRPARSRPTSAAATAPPRRRLTSSWGAPCSGAAAGASGRRRAPRGTSAAPPASAGGWGGWWPTPRCPAGRACRWGREGRASGRLLRRRREKGPPGRRSRSCWRAGRCWGIPRTRTGGRTASALPAGGGERPALKAWYNRCGRLRRDSSKIALIKEKHMW